MPGINGYETSVKLRGLLEDYRQASCPIVGLTGDGNEEVVAASLECGMVQVLVKPISKAELVMCLRGYIHILSST